MDQSDRISEMVSAPSAESAESSNVVEMIGIVLVPVAGVLMILAIGQAIYEIHHWATLPSYPTSPNGVSSSRRDGAILVNIAGGLIGPLAAALMWFDWIRSGMSRRSRLSLIGYLGGTIALMALLLPTAIIRG